MIGCSFEPEVDGIWQTSSDSAVDLSALLGEGEKGHVQLVAVQYGKEVAGLVQLFTQSFNPSDLHTDCPCLYLDKAVFKGDSLSFSVTGCDGAPRVGAFSLDPDNEDRLRGTLRDPNGGDPGEDWVLLRVGDRKQIREEGLERGCEP
jgi:hypothetical protein